MPKLPVVKPREVISFLKSQGFIKVRSVGSHFRFHHPDGRRTSVAFHNKPLKRKTLQSILRQIDFTVEEFVSFLKKK